MIVGKSCKLIYGKSCLGRKLSIVSDSVAALYERRCKINEQNVKIPPPARSDLGNEGNKN